MRKTDATDLSLLWNSAPFFDQRNLIELFTLETPLRRELKNPGAIEGIDDLQRAEATRAVTRGEITGLVQSLSIAARGPERTVLNGIHARAVLHIIVGMVEHVECLRTESENLPFRQPELTRDPNVDLLGPRAVERVQACERAGTSGVDAEGGIRSALKSGSIVDRDLRSSVGTPSGDVVGGAGNVD